MRTAHATLAGTSTAALTTAAVQTTWVVSSALGGAAGGFTAGLLSSGGEIKPAVRGGIGGGITGGVGGYFGNTWNVSRVAANSVAGGVSSELQGGQFRDGFKTSFITSSARLGWEYTRQATDASSPSSVYNDRGEKLTDGVRQPVCGYGEGKCSTNIFTRDGIFTMAAEGSGQHSYAENSWLGRVVNAVSKTHDWLNSFGYNSAGQYVSWGQGYDTLFQAYSLSGMLPAAAFTTAAQVAGPLTTYIEMSKRRE